MTDLTTAREPSLREQRRDETRRLIEQAAFDLFDQYGFRATTVERIAEAVGISPRTFFRYFPSKEDVLLSWYTKVAAHLEALPLRPGSAPDVLRQLQRGMDEFLVGQEFRENFRARTLRRLGQVADEDDELRGMFAGKMSSIANSLVGRVSDALGADADPLTVRLVLETFGAGMISALEVWLASSDSDDPTRLVEVHHRARSIMADLVTAPDSLPSGAAPERHRPTAAPAR